MSETAMTKAENNALVVSYDALGSHVELDLQFVKKYLVRGIAGWSAIRKSCFS